MPPMSPLLPCTHCRRHVRADAGTCPFCAGALSLVAPELRPVHGRLLRGAVFALGATAIVAGCSSGDGGQVSALYGVPPTDTGVDGATPDTRADSGGADGPGDTTTPDTTTPDSGTTDAGDAATDTRETSVAPPYGIPPSDGG